MDKNFTGKIYKILENIEEFGEYDFMTCKNENFHFKDLNNNQCYFKDGKLGKIKLSESNPEFYFGFSDRDSQRFTYYSNGKIILEQIENCVGLITININGEEIYNEKKNKQLNEKEQQNILNTIGKIVIQIENNLLMFYNQDEDEDDIPNYYD